MQAQPGRPGRDRRVTARFMLPTCRASPILTLWSTACSARWRSSGRLGASSSGDAGTPAARPPPRRGRRVVPVRHTDRRSVGDDPPRTAGKALQNIVLRVRRALEPDRTGPSRILVTEPGGYRLVTEALRVDAQRFEATGPLGVRAAGRTRARRAARGPGAMARRGVRRPRRTRRWWSPRRAGSAELRAVGARELGRGRARRRRRVPTSWPSWSGWWSSTPCASGCGRCSSARSTARVGRGRRSARWRGPGRCCRQSLGVDPGPELQGRCTSGSWRRTRGWRGRPEPRAPSRRSCGGARACSSVARTSWRFCGTCGSVSPPDSSSVCTSHCGDRPARAPQRLAAELAAEAAASGAEVAFVASPRVRDRRGLRNRPWRTVGAAAARAFAGVGGAGISGSRRRAGARASTAEGSRPGRSRRSTCRRSDVEELRQVVAPIVPSSLVDEVVGEVWEAVRRFAGSCPSPRHCSSSAPDGGAGADSAALRGLRGGDASRGQGRDGRERARPHRPRRRRATGWSRGLITVAWPAGVRPGRVGWFAGRERLVAEMLARLPGSAALAVVGASGSGKSSAVGAGLVASLRDGRLPGARRWTC